ncbi:hypothetical protein K474DRAFT_1679185 [Panus rudis PR-1116 ss-1]|nr:hypothetical protein K474DRAFT_1679185 [Panus rudis PR-1116 ss-1]
MHKWSNGKLTARRVGVPRSPPSGELEGGRLQLPARSRLGLLTQRFSDMRGLGLYISISFSFNAIISTVRPADKSNSSFIIMIQHWGHKTCETGCTHSTMARTRSESTSPFCGPDRPNLLARRDGTSLVKQDARIVYRSEAQSYRSTHTEALAASKEFTDSVYPAV